MPKQLPKNDDPVLEELVTIKRLLVLGLMRNGAPSTQIDAALRVRKGTVSKMFAGGTNAVVRASRKAKE